MQSKRNGRCRVAGQRLFFGLFLFGLLFAGNIIRAQETSASPVFIQFRVNEPGGQSFQITIGGFRHDGEPWVLPNTQASATGGAWSEWIDLGKYPFHKRMKRAGGVAEWSSLRLTVNRSDGGEAGGVSIDVRLANAPDEKSVVTYFTEKSASNTIAFLLPYPLRDNIKEFETGSQMTERHYRWARDATRGEPIVLKKFRFATQIWGHYDPALESRAVATLKTLGFSVVGNVRPAVGKESGIRTYGHTWLYEPDPDSVAAQWTAFAAANLAGAPGSDTDWKYRSASHWVISDEVSALSFQNLDKAKLNGWFRAYLRDKGLKDADLPKPIDEIEYPAAAMHKDILPRDGSLAERRLMYHAAKFGQWWSAKQLRQTTDLIQASIPGMKTETLLPSHGFFGNAWTPAHIGMSYRMLDFFEVGAQASVSELSAEDWLGLNHMYGPQYTWTGGQTFGYFNALLRSAIAERPIELRGLITPSDDKYLRLKAHSSIGQGAKSFFFWTFGPTYIGTENYWSDLRSEYDGIAKLGRTLEKTEDVLHPAKPVTDPVAIFYSVSHDLWHTDRHAAFVEKRLLWHALRHLQVQPDFVREEDAIAGKLKNYKVLYVTDWAISRSASRAIDEWVKAGGVLYMSDGAATRDEFHEPHAPPFAAAVWRDDPTRNFQAEKHLYNERVDLPKIKPLTTVSVEADGRKFNLPVVGVRLEMKESTNRFAAFADGKTAGVRINYGRGQIVAVGFMPMLAYGQLANFQPTTLEEKWTPEPRQIVKMALDAGKIDANVKSSVPVVEANLLTGADGSALVLANYTYQPIAEITLDVKVSHEVKTATSSEGVPVRFEKVASPGAVRLKLPLEWTDIILLK